MDRFCVLLQQLALSQAQAALLHINADPAEDVDYVDDAHVQKRTHAPKAADMHMVDIDLHRWWHDLSTTICRLYKLYVRTQAHCLCRAPQSPYTIDMYQCQHYALVLSNLLVRSTNSMLYLPT